MARTKLVLAGCALVGALLVSSSGSASSASPRVPSLRMHHPVFSATFDNSCARGLQLGRGPSMRD